MSPSLPSHVIHNIHYSLYMPRRSALTVEVKDVAVYYIVSFAHLNGFFSIA